LNRIVATDETWIRDFVPELKSQSCQQKLSTSPRPKKCRRQQSKVKLIMIMAYDKNGVIATDRVPPGSTVTGAYYTRNVTITDAHEAAATTAQTSPSTMIR